MQSFQRVLWQTLTLYGLFAMMCRESRYKVGFCFVKVKINMGRRFWVKRWNYLCCYLKIICF